MSSKQTAVEWLENILHDFIHPEHGAEFFPFVEKAKAMEKEQLEGAYFCGSQHSVSLNVKRFKYTCEESEKEAKEFYQTNYGGHY